MKKAGDRPAFFFIYAADGRRQRVSSACASWPSSYARPCGRSCGPWTCARSCGPCSCERSCGRLTFSASSSLPLSFWLPSSRSIQEWVSHLSTGGPASYSKCNFERCTITCSCKHRACIRDRREYRNCRVNHAIANVQRETSNEFGNSSSADMSRAFSSRSVRCARAFVACHETSAMLSS